MISKILARPTAMVTIEPTGSRTAVPREHAIKLAIRFKEDNVLTDSSQVTTAARKALAAFLEPDQVLDTRRCDEVTIARKATRATPAGRIIVGVEGYVISAGPPPDALVEGLKTALLAEGWVVSIRVKRECVEPSCTVHAMVAWNRGGEVPPGWFGPTICGRHNHRVCPACKSVYVMTSQNAAGQAPSVHCEVCGKVIVEWGSSKVWTAVLLTRGTS